MEYLIKYIASSRASPQYLATALHGLSVRLRLFVYTLPRRLSSPTTSPTNLHYRVCVCVVFNVGRAGASLDVLTILI